MKTSIITCWSDFDKLESEWDDLLTASRSDCIFLTWDWLNTWRSVTGEKAAPFVVTVRDETGLLIGAAPYYVTKLKLFNLLGFVTLRVMADVATGSEYGDWIVHRDLEEEASTSIAIALSESKTGWDCIWMPRMAGWTGALTRVVQASQSAGLLHHSRNSPFGYIDLPPEMKLYEERFSSNRRQQMRRKRRKLMSRDGVASIRCEKPEELEWFLNALFDLHYRRWQLEGEIGSFRRKPLMEDFYRRFIPIALKKDWLRLYAIVEHGVIKAIQIGYLYKNEFLQLQEGFDPDYVQGVGNVLRTIIIEECIKEGIEGYDFLGGMSEHKKRWGAVKREGHDLMIAHPDKLKNRLLFMKEVWPTGRFLSEAEVLDGN